MLGSASLHILASYYQPLIGALRVQGSMTNFYHMINHETEVMNRLQRDVHSTFLKRGKDRESWSKACEKFHSYVSPIDHAIDEIYESPALNNKQTLEFVLTFLEIDPMFFRSGYVKEDMIQRLKRTNLTQEQLTRVNSILTDAVENRGHREFKRYCRLAKFMGTDSLVKILEGIVEHNTGARKSRAKLMLSYMHT